MDQLFVKCLTLNVRGIRDRSKRRKIFQWLEEQKCDVIFLQETFCTVDVKNDIERDWKGKIINAPSDSSHSRGCMILFSKHSNCKIIDSHSSLDGRKILVNVLLNEQIFTLVCCYAPNIHKARNSFFEGLTTWINQYSQNDQSIICAGDFNCIDNIQDRQTGSLDGSSKHFTSFKEQLNLVDTWRSKHPDILSYTYIDPKNICSSRIDYILTTERLSTCISESLIVPTPAPDHKAVITVLQKNIKKRGAGYWKLNNSVIDEEEYVHMIESIIDMTVGEYEKHLSYTYLWDLIKVRIKEASIKYCQRRKRSEKNIRRGLENLVNRIDLLLHNKTDDSNSCDLENQRKKRVKELDSYYLKEAQGAQIRSRAKWVEEGEKSSSYFFRLELARQESNVISCLRSPEGITETDDTRILELASEFYENLFKTKSPNVGNIDKYLNNINRIKTLQDEESNKCEGLISMNEAEKASKSMKLNKSPGPDGLTAEFYHRFWDKLGPLLVKVYNECYQNGKLVQTQREAIITLIYKGGDRQDIKNYRPISLTNVDYKILAFVLSNRLQDVIGNIVSADQSGYIKGRFIGNNIRLIEDLIEESKKMPNKFKGVLLFLDFKKAFDSLEWEFMFKTLDKFKFGDSFKKWVKILYTDPTCKVKNNGYISSAIKMTRGVRQGCPLSALLFILSVEVLAESVRRSKEIQGIDMIPYGYNRQAIISQYADDSILILKDNRQVDSAILQVEQFSKVSGLELNLQKTQGMLLGLERNIPKDKLNNEVTWTNKPIRCLGIFVGYDKQECEKYNWDRRIDKIQQILDRWKARNLTLLGKILVLKTLVNPQLIYPACNSVTAYHIIPRVNKMFFSFVWPTIERIKRNTLIGPKEEGGLQMTHTESLFDALNSSWIKRFLMVDSKEPPTWSIIPKYYLNKIGDNYLALHFNLDADILPIINTLPHFYSQVIKSWNKAKEVKGPDDTNLLNEMIWGNKYVTIKSKRSKQALYFKNWIEVGIIFIKDLMINNSVVDDIYVYNKLANKINFFHEMTVVKKALNSVLKGKNVNNTPIVTEHARCGKDLNTYPMKTRDLYVKLMRRHFEPPDIERKWNINNSMVTQSAFIHKVKWIPETKIAEFGFKVLHKILACPANLKKWKITDNDDCSLCTTKDDIRHLLVDCLISRFVWKSVFDVLEINLENCEQVVLFGHTDRIKNIVISQIAYLIYKYWILQNKKKIAKNITTFKPFIQNEIACKLKVCEMINKQNKYIHSATNNLKQIMTALRNE